jgi:hypothetical protein
MVNKCTKWHPVKTINKYLNFINPKKDTFFIERAYELTNYQVFIHLKGEKTMLPVRGHPIILNSNQ